MKRTFNDTAKEEVRNRADIVAIVGRYVKLKQSGRTFKGLCPFHKEKTPSFHVNPVRGFFHCFGCGKGGDVFSFLQEIEGASFPEILKMLAEETGVTLSHEQPDASLETDPSAPSFGLSLSKTVMFDIHIMAAEYFYSMIGHHPQAIAYFKSRGLVAQTVHDFRLGYAPPGWSSLLSAAASKNISADALVTCGLALKNAEGSTYDRFRDRIIFSLTDLSGRVIGFAGRGLEADATPKYLNSPETALYRKKEFLYGLNSTRHYIKEENSALVVEGYMDFLTLYQAGIRNVVSTSGTALTPEHAHLLMRFTSRLILVFDGDEAGQNAAERGVFTLAPFDFDIFILTLPPEEDPDSFVKAHGADPFRALLSEARNSTDFIIDRAIALNGNRTPRSQKAVITQLLPLYQAITNSVAKNRFRKELADRLGLKEVVVDQEMRTHTQARAQEVTTNANRTNLMHSPRWKLLHLLINRPELIAEARSYISADIFTDGEASELFSLVLDFYDVHGNLNGIIDAVQNSETQKLLSSMLASPALEEDLQPELVQQIIRLHKNFLRSRIHTNRMLLKSEKNTDLKSALMLQIQNDMKQHHDLDENE
jgi:DNA primase